MTLELQTQLAAFGLIDSTLNSLAEAGIKTLDDLLQSNERQLRSLSIRKEPRIKILAWICSIKCVFSLTLFSHNFAAGLPEQFTSAEEFKLWEPYVNRLVSPADKDYNELQWLLGQSGIVIRPKAEALNIAMPKLKVLIQHARPASPAGSGSRPNSMGGSRPGTNGSRRSLKSDSRPGSRPISRPEATATESGADAGSPGGGGGGWRSQVPAFEGSGAVVDNKAPYRAHGDGALEHAPRAPPLSPPPPEPRGGYGPGDSQSTTAEQSSASAASRSTDNFLRTRVPAGGADPFSSAASVPSGGGSVAESSTPARWQQQQQQQQQSAITDALPVPRRPACVAHGARSALALRPSTVEALVGGGSGASGLLHGAGGLANPQTLASSAASAALRATTAGPLRRRQRLRGLAERRAAAAEGAFFDTVTATVVVSRGGGLGFGAGGPASGASSGFEGFSSQRGPRGGGAPFPSAGTALCPGRSPAPGSAATGPAVMAVRLSAGMGNLPSSPLSRRSGTASLASLIARGGADAAAGGGGDGGGAVAVALVTTSVASSLGGGGEGGNWASQLIGGGSGGLGGFGGGFFSGSQTLSGPAEVGAALGPSAAPPPEHWAGASGRSSASAQARLVTGRNAAPHGFAGRLRDASPARPPNRFLATGAGGHKAGPSPLSRAAAMKFRSPYL